MNSGEMNEVASYLSMIVSFCKDEKAKTYCDKVMVVCANSVQRETTERLEREKKERQSYEKESKKI